MPLLISFLHARYSLCVTARETINSKISVVLKESRKYLTDENTKWSTPSSCVMSLVMFSMCSFVEVLLIGVKR